MKVLGVKVENEVYARFSNLDGSVSSNLREAINLFLKYKENKLLTSVNQESCFNCRYQELCVFIDKYLNKEKSEKE